MAKENREIKQATVEQLESELKRTRKKGHYRRTFRSTVYVLVVVAAAAILVATLWMPVLRIYGTSMMPTLDEGNIVVSVKDSRFETGELVSFYYGNRLLVKRVIAGPGDWVDMDQQGNVFVNGALVDEPYLTEKEYGDVTIQFPYQVPETRYFALGDHRSTSVDSRNQVIGCISEEQIVGKIVFRVWPLSQFGKL